MGEFDPFSLLSLGWSWHGKVSEDVDERTNVENALLQLVKLTQEECLMTPSRTLEVTHRVANIVRDVDGGVKATKSLTKAIDENVKATKALTKDINANVT